MNLVPFALNKSTNKLVDVHDVPRGRTGCICPSCGIELVAKQGDIKHWHFAHYTKDKSKNDIEQCEFSFFVSVSMMARQLIGGMHTHSLLLPEYIKKIENERITEHVNITIAGQTSLSQLKVDASVNGQTFDFTGTVEGQGKKADIPLAFLLTYPGKKSKPLNPSLKGSRVGILEVNLGGLETSFWENKKSMISFRSTLLDHIFLQPEHKKWLYHPRQDRMIKQAAEKLQKKVEAEQQLGYHYGNLNDIPSLPPFKHLGKSVFYCSVCGEEYRVSARYGRNCPYCAVKKDPDSYTY